MYRRNAKSKKRINLQEKKKNLFICQRGRKTSNYIQPNLIIIMLIFLFFSSSSLGFFFHRFCYPVFFLKPYFVLDDLDSHGHRYRNRHRIDYRHCLDPNDSFLICLLLISLLEQHHLSNRQFPKLLLFHRLNR